MQLFISCSSSEISSAKVQCANLPPFSKSVRDFVYKILQAGSESCGVALTEGGKLGSFIGPSCNIIDKI